MTSHSDGEVVAEDGEADLTITTKSFSLLLLLFLSNRLGTWKMKMMEITLGSVSARYSDDDEATVSMMLFSGFHVRILLNQSDKLN